MMFLMAAGVKKSLQFNNILNAVNLSAWVFLMSAGLFYVDTSNWTQHKGFLPFGWSGVRTYYSYVVLYVTRLFTLSLTRFEPELGSAPLLNTLKTTCRDNWVGSGSKSVYSKKWP